jgi:AcrR family transcriptional regulator
MEALAKKLGVGRRTLSYHVRDREELVTLMAMDVYASLIEQTRFPEGATWQEMLRIQAKSLYFCLTKMGPLAAYVKFPGDVTPGVLGVAETTLEALADAGFDESESLLVLVLLVRFAASTAVERQLADSLGSHPQLVQLVQLLADSPQDELPALRAAIAASVPQEPDADIDFGLDVLMAGLEARLAAKRRGERRR